MIVTEVAAKGTRLDLDWDVVLWLEHKNDCVLYYYDNCVSQINVNILTSLIISLIGHCNNNVNVLPSYVLNICG